MKIGLKFKFNDQPVVLNVHELLRLAQELMQQKCSGARKSARRSRNIRGVHKGRIYNPLKLTTPDEWLYKSNSLKQGVPKKSELAKIINKNKVEYSEEKALRLIEYYREKINIDEMNSQIREESLPVWNFAIPNIKKMVRNLSECFNATQNLINYYIEDLGEVKSIDEVKFVGRKKKLKDKAKTRARGIYIYQLDSSVGVNKCLIIHGNDKFDEPVLDDMDIVSKIKEFDNNEEGSLIRSEIKNYFNNKKSVKFDLTYFELKLALDAINHYLSTIKYPIYTPKNHDFLNLFRDIYKTRCQVMSDNHNLTYVRCMISDLMTPSVMIELLETFVFADSKLVDISDEEKLIRYSAVLEKREKLDNNVINAQPIEDGVAVNALSSVDITDKTMNIKATGNLLTTYCQKHKLGFYDESLNDDGLVNLHHEWFLKLCPVTFLSKEITARQLCYLVACLRSEHHSGWSAEKLKRELMEQESDIPEFASTYTNECDLKNAYHLLCKRLFLYKTYNALNFLRQLSTTFPSTVMLPSCNTADNKVKCLLEYSKLLKKIMSENTLETGMYGQYTLLRLFCRLGYQIDEEVKSKLLDKVANERKGDENCYDFCAICEKLEWNHEQRPTNFDKPSVIFFNLGNRVYGINQSDAAKSLYVYDYGTLEDTFAKKYSELKQLKQTWHDKLQMLKDDVTGCNDYINKLIGWYEEEILPIVDKSIEDPQKRNISVFTLDLDFYCFYTDTEQIRKVLLEKSETFFDEALRTQHVEQLFKINVIDSTSVSPCSIRVT